MELPVNYANVIYKPDPIDYVHKNHRFMPLLSNINMSAHQWRKGGYHKNMNQLKQPN
jgi:hypothetical protein